MTTSHLQAYLHDMISLIITPQNRAQPEVQLHVGIFEVCVLAHVASRISIVIILRPGKFPRQF